MRKIDTIIIHCAATPPDMDIGAEEIDRWHRDRGWAGIGYHFVIRRNGVVEPGRSLAKVGAHAKGHNRTSIGVCMVGGARRDGKKLVADDNFTPEQWRALKKQVRTLLELFPACRVIGHRDVEPGKECPSFSVREWAKMEGIAQAPRPV